MSSTDSGFEPSYDTCEEVTLQCPVEATLYGAPFTRGATLFFVVAYALLLVSQLWLTFKSRAWSFSAYLAVGTIFELIGYQSRLEMVDNPWAFDPFQKQLLLLILGPTLVAASMSVTFKHLVVYYGREYSVLRPRLYPYVFVGSDVVAIIVQGAGAILAGQGDDLMDLSSGLLIGGVSFQLVNMLGCGLLMVVYWRRYRAHRGSVSYSGEEAGNVEQVGAIDPRKVRWFVWGVATAFIFIIVRCAYRIPEMATGWGSTLMQNETLFLIFDGAMVLIAVTVLCALHPAYLFPRLGKPTRAQRKSEKENRRSDRSGYMLWSRGTRDDEAGCR